LDALLPVSIHPRCNDRRANRASNEEQEEDMSGRISRAIVATIAGVAMLATLAAAPAVAKRGDVIRRGACSGRSDWKLKLSPENGRIETGFEVDQNVNGRTWRVRIRHDGDLVFSGLRTTRAPSGSFEVRLIQANRAGRDVFTARAVNPSSGEICSGRAVFSS
jgi:hypothetical protein